MALSVQDKLIDRAAATVAARRLMENIKRVIRGRDGAVETAVSALFAGGHLLVEDVPGVGKTMLARSMALSIDGTYKRIQATPDLLPSDVTGAAIFNQARAEFQFIEGPVFTNVLLVDEINRTTPRTQSALLEAMDENAVTVDGVRHPLPDPLFVVATQNPIEHHGTYPLPEGQLDRFAIAMGIGYVSADDERSIIKAQLHSHPIEELEPVLSPGEVVAARVAARATHVSDAVIDYALRLTRGTRHHPDLELGASPRASITLIRCAQAAALIAGRDFVVPDDVKALATSALAHRLLPIAGMRLERGHAQAVVTKVLEGTNVPVTEQR